MKLGQNRERKVLTGQLTHNRSWANHDDNAQVTMHRDQYIFHQQITRSVKWKHIDTNFYQKFAVSLFSKGENSQPYLFLSSG